MNANLFKIDCLDNPAEKYNVSMLPMQAVWSDDMFNCRGPIAAREVIDLAKNIAARGLDQPIIVRPWTEASKPLIQYKVVAGHRRHKAFEFNGAQTIPAYVRTDLDELQAHFLNVHENLHRENLNVKQEAHALQYFLDYKIPGTSKCRFTIVELAEVFGTSRGWVQNRMELLKLPLDIQDEAASGMLTMSQVKILANLKNREQLYATVRKIKEKKIKGEKVRLTSSIRRVEDVMRPKERDRHEINELQGMIYDIIGPTLVTRVMAWCQGEISTSAVMFDLEAYCKAQGIPFTMPVFVTNALMGRDTPVTANI